MTYYKIIADGVVVDAGFVFLKWDEKHHCMMRCDVNDAQFIQSYDQTAVYRADWLRPAPADAGEYAMVEAVVISETEYDEIRAMLDDGETVIDDPEQPIQPPEDDPEQDDDTPAERPMTVAEMRRIITEQQEQINMLTDCILEMSEVVYGG